MNNTMRLGYFLLLSLTVARAALGAEVVDFFGYDDCILLSNDRTRVVLCPAAGGRVLEYSLGGENALYLNFTEKGWLYEPGKQSEMSAGRFDIGPEKIVPSRPQLWMGRWNGEVTGPNSARMTSVKDKATGTQLIRDFELAETGSKLICRQTIKNISDKTTEWCHWSRTFALGNGVCVIPLSQRSRFPNHYVMYEGANSLNFRPQDPNIKRIGEFLVILGVPQHPKLGMDSKVGWFAYLMKNDLMFVKRFPTYDDRVYNEVAGLTISIWYPTDRRVELEPIGPRQRLEPGERASFTETWELMSYVFPSNVETMNPREVSNAVLLESN